MSWAVQSRPGEPDVSLEPAHNGNDIGASLRRWQACVHLLRRGIVEGSILTMARTQAVDYEQRREAIVDHAATLFARTGFRGTSVAELATACNTSKSLIYHYYPSKEDILYAVMASHVDQLTIDVEQVMAAGGSAGERLADLVHRFMDHYVGAADRQKVLLNELDNLPTGRRAEIVAKQRAIVNAVTSLLARGDDPRDRARAMLLFGMINWTHTWYDPAGPLTPSDIADMALGLIQGEAAQAQAS